MAQENAAAENQNAVTLKLPPFWTSQPRVWFQQAEAQFALRHVTADDTKYYYVVAALDQETAQRLLSLLENPPPDDKYQGLKQRLLATFDLSQQERAARLLNMPGLGDRKPSALMDDMLALLGNHASCFLFTYLFLQHLPEDVRTILAGENIDDPRTLAQRADILWLARSKEPMIARIHARQPPPKQNNYRQKTSALDQVGLCFYHRRFGDKAHRCVSPCNFAENIPAGRR